MDDEGHPLEKIVVVRTEKEDMLAYLAFIGHYDDKIEKSVVYDIIASYGVIYGLQVDDVDKAITEFSLDQKNNVKKNYLIAKGLPMAEGKDGYVEYLVEETAPVQIDETGKADFRNIEKFHTVHKGTMLAKIHHAVKGTTGFNVYGEKMDPAEVREETILAGNNVTINESSGEVYANVTGIYNKTKNHLSISQVLTIKGDVGLETGNLAYEGVIKIGGTIELGAKVESQGDLYVEGLIESGDVKVGGSLNVKGGIKTRNEGMVNVKKRIVSTYIENSNVYSDMGITVINAIIGSKLITCGDVVMLKDGSKIVGGEMTALQHICSDNLGNMNETHTIVTIGTHYQNMVIYNRVLKEFTLVEKHLNEFLIKIQEIKEFITRSHGNISQEKKIQFKMEFDQYKNVEADYKVKKEKVESIKDKRYFDGDVFIHVKNVLYPGVLIHAFNLTEKINCELKHCTLRFKKGEEGYALETYNPPDYLKKPETH